MNEHTPNTDQVRDLWRAGRHMQLGLSIYLDGERSEGEFDRWLAEVERAAAEKAWDECARAQLEYEQSVRREWPWNPYRKETR